MILRELTFAQLNEISDATDCLLLAAQALIDQGLQPTFDLTPGQKPTMRLPYVLLPASSFLERPLSPLSPRPTSSPDGADGPHLDGAEAVSGGGDAAPANVPEGLSDEERQFVFRETLAGYAAGFIASELDVPTDLVIAEQVRLQPQIDRVRKAEADARADANFVTAYFELGWSAQMIADELGLATTAVERIIENLKLVRPQDRVVVTAEAAPLTPYGEALLRSGVTEKTLVEIAPMAPDGEGVLQALTLIDSVAAQLVDYIEPNGEPEAKTAPIDAMIEVLQEGIAQTDAAIDTVAKIAAAVAGAEETEAATVAIPSPTPSAPWTEAEDAVLVEMVAIARNAGTPINAAVNAAADQLGRPFQASHFRAYNKLKARIAARAAELRDYEPPVAEAAGTEKPGGDRGGLQQLHPAKHDPVQGVVETALQPATPEVPALPTELMQQPIVGHLMSLPSKGWTMAQDAELLRLAVDGWRMGDIALDQSRDPKEVQARFDLLTGLDRDTRTRRFKMADLAAALDSLIGKPGVAA